MPPVNISIGGTSSRYPVLPHRVYTKVEWEEEWEEQSEVHCINASWSASPTTPEATIYFRYGLEVRGIFSRFILPTLGYVKIEFDAYDLSNLNGPKKQLVWYGVAGQIVDQIMGSDVRNPEDPDVKVPTGFQSISCIGLDWLLDQDFLLAGLWVQRRQWAGGTWIENDVLRTTGHAPKFDKNRVANFEEMEAWCFDLDGEHWHTQSVVEYLLARVTIPITFRLRESAMTLLPDWDEVVLEAHGFSIGSLLKRLLARERAIGFYFEVVYDETEDKDVVELVPFTFAESLVNIDTGKTIPANPQQINLTLNDHGSAINLVTDSFARFQSVRVIGARSRHCFTVKVDAESGFVERDWTEAEEGIYLEGASASVGYPPAEEIDARNEKNDRFRYGFLYTHVFRRFKLIPDKPVTFDGGVAIAKLDPTPGDLTDVPPYWELASDHGWLEKKTVLASLPILLGKDYVAEELPFEEIRDDAEEDRPFAIYRYQIGNDEYRWAEARYLFEYGESVKAGHANGWHWAGEVQPLADPLKFEFHVNGANQMVVDARTIYFGEDTLETDKQRLGGFLDWRLDELHFTLALEGDHYCEWIENAPSSETGSDELARQKIIAVGDKYRLDRIAVGTIIGVDADGEPIKFDRTDYVRDDREKLKPIAKRALQWYGKDRKALHFQTSWVTDSLKIGDLVRTLNDGSETLTTNSVITQLVVTMPLGIDQAPLPKIEYATSFAELDVIGNK